MGAKVINERYKRWYSCNLCEQRYHGVVACALSWACWKTYVGRPERDVPRRSAIRVLGNGLHEEGRDEDALIVQEAELAMELRLGSSENDVLVAQNNLALTYALLGRNEEALQMRRDVYSGRLRLDGEEHQDTLLAANNYSASLCDLQRFEEARTLLRRTVPAIRRVLGEGHRLTLKTRWLFAEAIYLDTSAKLDDVREAVTMLEDTARTARRVLGGTHPLTQGIERALKNARAALALALAK